MWFGDPSPTQSWRGDVTVYFVQPQMTGHESGFELDGWYHHSRRRLMYFNGSGGR